MSFYLYVETAFHHEGNKEYLIKLVDEAKKSGAKGVKFQVLINLSEFMSTKHSAYQDTLRFILTFQDWKDIFTYTKNMDLDIILMPLDIKAFELANYFDIKYIEIHSVLFKDTKLLSKLRDYNIPIILGIGGRTKEEIDWIVNKYNDKDIILMVGFQSFPSLLDDIKLEKISILKNMYPQCIIGYADHSSYDSTMAIRSNEYAYILGARVFEKHISINEGEERVDFQSAISGDKIKQIINNLNYLQTIFSHNNETIFELNDKEIIYRNRQKIPVASQKILKDTIINESMIELKMINSTNSEEDINIIIGKKISKNIDIDEAFDKEVLYI